VANDVHFPRIVLYWAKSNAEEAMKKNVAVLGAGLVGSAIVRDLAQEEAFQVTVVDVDQQALEQLQAKAPVKAVQANLRTEGGVAAAVAGSDLVVCAVPGFMGFETLKQVIRAGKDVVDISFFAEDAFLLDDLARARGVTAVVDCGVAPGLSHIIAGYVDTWAGCHRCAAGPTSTKPSFRRSTCLKSIRARRALSSTAER
jgi:shikimate 5-dehydrogenase